MIYPSPLTSEPNSKMYTYRVKRIVKVIDGDTVDLEIDLGFGITLSQRVRLKGINAPETRTADHSEKTKGLASKEWLELKFAEGDEWVIETAKEDKYGRYLGTLRKPGNKVSINEEMIEKGLAVPYMVEVR